MLKIALVIVPIVTLVALGRGESITLTANEDLATYAISDYTPVKTTIILPKDSSNRVMGCTDLKHYIAADVTVDGNNVVVIGGKFHLERRSFLTTWRWPIVWSCP